MQLCAAVVLATLRCGGRALVLESGNFALRLVKQPRHDSECRGENKQDDAIHSLDSQGLLRSDLVS